MGLFGKILAVFNVLAAIAFFCVIAADYSNRSQWSYSHFRHQVALHGLPVGNDENSWRLPGRSIASDLTKNSLDDIFRSVGGDPSRTQVDEVVRLQKTIENEVTSAPDVNTKRTVLARYLIPIQTTGADRERVIAQLRAAKDDAALSGLWEKLKLAFETAVSETTPQIDGVEQRRRDLLARRQTIADLLYNIMPATEWHARVQTVVGLEQYTLAANRQADRLARMAQRLRDAIADERTKFVKDYQILLPELKNLSLDLKRYEARLNEQNGLLSRYTAMKTTREAEVADLNQKIQSATRIAATERDALQALEQRLFAVQQQLAAAQAENQRLERDIRSQETAK